MKELDSLIALLQVPLLGPRRIQKLYHHTQGQLSLLFEKAQWSAYTQEHFPKLADYSVDWSSVERNLAWGSVEGQHLLAFWDPTYPELLKNIVDFPPLLWVKGQGSCLQMPALAMVGTRIPSAQGARTAFEFAKNLAEAGLVIVSGLAQGIDTAAHQGTLAAQRPTVAVLGHGFDTLYPKSNIMLADQIRRQGALVSEFALDVQPSRENFPRRNRIISGLTLATFVVEAALKSGSLITARYAGEQGRDVFALPGSIYSTQARGTHALIREGALLVETVEDILEALCGLKLTSQH